MGSTAALLMLVVFGQASVGCSLIFTKGPQPEVQPPPPCTSDNGFPVADTVIAVASGVAVIAGGAAFANGMAKQDQFNSDAVYGGLALILGGIGTLIFTPSAIVGFNRTADCRAWLAANPQKYAPRPSPSSPASSLLLAPAQGCPTSGDVPRMCSSGAPGDQVRSCSATSSHREVHNEDLTAADAARRDTARVDDGALSLRLR